MDFIPLIIQLLSGAAGGNIAGSLFKNLDLGTLGNSLAGIVGGGIGGQLLATVLPALVKAAGSGSLDIGAIVGQVASGGVGGGVLMVIVGLVKQMLSGAKS